MSTWIWWLLAIIIVLFGLLYWSGKRFSPEKVDPSGGNPGGNMRVLDLHTEFFRPTKRVLINDDCERPLPDPLPTFANIINVRL